MLLVICDEAVGAQLQTECAEAFRAGLETAAGPVTFAADISEVLVAGASSGPSVVWLSRSAERAVIEAAAASAAEIVVLLLVAAGVAQPVSQRGANAAAWRFVAAFTAPRTAVWLCATGGARPDPTGELSAALGAHRAVRIMRPGSRRARRQMHRLGRALVTAACAPQRLDRSDGVVRRREAAGAATDSLQELLSEPDVEEFQIRGGEAMIVQHAGGRVERRPSPFAADEDLIEAVRFLAAYSGDRPQRFDELDPRLDVRVGDRWRLHAEAFVTSPPNVVLRSNLAGRMQLADLGFVSPELGSVLIEAIAGRTRANVVVAAAMGGGKTTLCQALLAAVPDHERIDTIEDTPELRLHEYGIHPNTYERLTRDPNQDGHGRHSMADHIRDAKRANVGKLVVGEIRGDGCEALLDAMSSGLDGCLVTLHSQAGKGVLEKLVAYACSEGAEPGYARRQIAAAVDLCVWMGRNTDGQRVVADVTQLTGIDEVTGVISTACLWALHSGERWATPVGNPVGRVASVYSSAGLRVDGSAQPDMPTLFLLIVDTPTANAELLPAPPSGRASAPIFAGQEPQPPEQVRASTPAAAKRRRSPRADAGAGASRRAKTLRAASAPPEETCNPPASAPMFDPMALDACSPGEVLWDPGPLVPLDDAPPYEPLVPESWPQSANCPDADDCAATEQRRLHRRGRELGGSTSVDSVPC